MFDVQWSVVYIGKYFAETFVVGRKVVIRTRLEGGSTDQDLLRLSLCFFPKLIHFHQVWKSTKQPIKQLLPIVLC